jgi:2-polyprenyl-3-methyl-5-hydroxy-6-metoxy-1,4-benzoquinol methylase
MNEQQAADFTGRVLTDTAAAATTVLAAFGDRLGLFKDLADRGPATSAQLASRTGLNERYVREWLAGMYSAGYVGYDPADQRYTMPEEHVPTLVTEPGPAFFGGVHQELIGALQRYDAVLQAFRTGGGVHHTDLHPDVAEGTSRFTAQWHKNMLVEQWLPLVPRTAAKLRDGARVADVGCGAGRAIIALAQAFPESTFAGYDVSPAAIETAKHNAQEAGVEDRVGFAVLDVTAGLPEHYDVITTFDVVHDAVDPLGLLRSIRDGLRTGGTYLCLDINCSAEPVENIGPIASLLYGFSIMYCMTTSLAEDGEGLGTLGLPESKLRDLAAKAGFAGVERVEMDNPFNNLYELAR